MFTLINFSCKNNNLTTLAPQNGIIEEYIDFSGNPGLTSVFCDANEVVYMQNLCNQYDNDTAVVNGNCNNQANRISMYPNPVGDRLHLSANFDI